MCSDPLHTSQWLSRHLQSCSLYCVSNQAMNRESLSESSNNTSCPAQHGKIHQVRVVWTNLFTGLETWAALTISHSDPHGLICLCHQALMPVRSRGLNQGIMFSTATEGTKEAILWALSIRGWWKIVQLALTLWACVQFSHSVHEATDLLLLSGCPALILVYWYIQKLYWQDTMHIDCTNKQLSAELLSGKNKSKDWGR